MEVFSLRWPFDTHRPTGVSKDMKYVKVLGLWWPSDRLYLLPSRSAWTHCLASCVMSSSSVDPITLEVLRAPDAAVMVSPALSTSGCTGVCIKSYTFLTDSIHY